MLFVDCVLPVGRRIDWPSSRLRKRTPRPPCTAAREAGYTLSHDVSNEACTRYRRTRTQEGVGARLRRETRRAGSWPVLLVCDVYGEPQGVTFRNNVHTASFLVQRAETGKETGTRTRRSTHVRLATSVPILSLVSVPGTEKCVHQKMRNFTLCVCGLMDFRQHKR